MTVAVLEPHSSVGCERVQEQVQNIYNWMWNENRRGTEHILIRKETKCR